ncbi:hypothetical protein BGLA2_390024 [Burkholderia gladioli]|nr:hypothetical protein BGLA2_390024 [Burkholderia gladioli]
MRDFLLGNKHVVDAIEYQSVAIFVHVIWSTRKSRPGATLVN